MAFILPPTRHSPGHSFTTIYSVEDWMREGKARVALTTFLVVIDPSPPTPRIRHHLQTPEDRATRIWRLEMRQLCARPYRPSFPDRRAEDRQEGAQGDPGQEEQEVKALACFCFLFGCSRSVYDADDS